MRLHKNIKLLAWFNFFLDFRLYAPVAIIYFSEVSGSYALGMSIFSLTMISSSFFEVPTGIYSDLIGRKKTLVWGAVFSLICVIIYAIGQSYLFLAIGAILEGIARSFYSGNNEALLVDTLAETNQQEEYSQFLGTTSSMFQWALAISAVLGGIIASYSFAAVMWLSVIPAFIGVLISFQIVEPRVHKIETTNIFAHTMESLKRFKNNKKLRTLSLSNIISYSAGEASYLFTSAFVVTLWPIWAIGFAKMLSNIGAAFSFHFSGRIIKKYHSFPVIIFGKVYSIVSGIIATIYPTAVSPVLLSSTSIFHGTETVGFSNLLQREYSAHQRSTMDSLNSLFGNVGFAIVAFVLGLFADQIGPALALLSLNTLSVISVFLMYKAFKS